jgi:hypothetical protein
MQPKTNPFIPREHVQVHVENLLHGCLPVCQERVYAFAPQPTRTQGCRDPARDTHQVGCGLSIQGTHEWVMLIWDDQHMAGVDWLYVHECSA